MSTINGVKDQLIRDTFTVFDSAGAEVDDLVNANFTKLLFDETGTEVSGSIPVTVTFLSDGEYVTTFTPDESGSWTARVTNATYNTQGWKSQYQIYDSAFSIHTVADIWNALTSGLTTVGSIGKYIVDYLDKIFQVGVGRWKLDKTANTQTFYESDKTTPIVTFDTTDSDGNPASENVYERVPR